MAMNLSRMKRKSKKLTQHDILINPRGDKKFRIWKNHRRSNMKAVFEGKRKKLSVPSSTRFGKVPCTNNNTLDRIKQLKESQKRVLLELHQGRYALKIFSANGHFAPKSGSLALIPSMHTLLDVIEISNVHALYLQNCGIEKKLLKRLTEVIVNNPRIYALNLGETNYFMPEDVWNHFLDGLEKSSVGFLYLTESVPERVRKEAKKIIRKNRETKFVRSHDWKLTSMLELNNSIRKTWFSPVNSRYNGSFDNIETGEIGENDDESESLELFNPDNIDNHFVHESIDKQKELPVSSHELFARKRNESKQLQDVNPKKEEQLKILKSIKEKNKANKANIEAILAQNLDLFN